MYSQTLPFPKNDMLYTEFVSYKKASYLKNPIKTVGYIVMNGNGNFLFKQISPIVIEVRKKDGRLTFKKENSQPIEIPNSPGGENIAFLFDKNSNYSNFIITKNVKNNKDFFLVVPKNQDKIEKIEIVSNDDKIESIILFFKDKSSMTYDFKNTVTGIVPDEKYF